MTPDYLNELLKETDAAHFLKMSVRTLQGMRLRGGGPKFVRISHRAVRYRRSDLFSWMEGKLRVSNTPTKLIRVFINIHRDILNPYGASLNFHQRILS